MKDDVRNYELKFDEIRKKLEKIEKNKDNNKKEKDEINDLSDKSYEEPLEDLSDSLYEEHLESFEPDIDYLADSQDDIDKIFEEKELDYDSKFEVEDLKDELEKEEAVTEDDGTKEEKKADKKKTDKFMVVLCAILPMITVLSVICLHSTYLFRKPFNYIIFAVNIILYIVFIVKLVLKIKNKGKNAKHSKLMYAIFYVLLVIDILACTAFCMLLYGPNDKFRNWLVTTAMRTKDHQYLCKWFYNMDEINYVLNNNYVLESGESTDVTLIEKEKKEEIVYENEYEEAILKREEGTPYKIIELDVNGCKGYLAAIYDPSKVKLAVTQGLGRYGQYVTTMAKNNNAILAINGGGFSDPGHSGAGGTPTGITISNGKIITNGEYGTNNQGGGIIGMTNDGVLVLLKNTTAQQALNMGVRDAVSWGPFLIVNGTPSFIKGNGGWGYAARTAIGQRKDGIILFLTVDSNASRTNGADMVDLTEIMQTYGAINAANLDGGTSTVMVMPKAEAVNYNKDCVDAYCYINNPIDGALRRQTRAIADAWIVVE